MSGLASKWATDEELVNKAKIQDSESRKHGTHSQKSIIPNKSDTTKPLESKWANISSEPSKVPTYKESRSKFDDGSKYSRSGRNKGRNDRKYENNAYGSLPSPPSTAENDALPNNSNNSHVSRGGSGNPPRGGRGYKTPVNNKGKKYSTVKTAEDSDESEEERTVPMSKAGASFASRLGIPSKTSTNGTVNNEHSFESTDEEVTDDDDDGFEDIVESEDDEEEELPPMTSAGQSLASRLGMVSITNTKSEPPRARQNFKQAQLQLKHSNNSPKLPKTLKGSYQTPKQKREEQARKEQEEKERLQKQKDAKLKEEVRDMFSKLTSSSANWADLEDED